jgi:hypothetical protein
VLGDDQGGLAAWQHTGAGYAIVHSADVGTTPIDGITLGPLNQIWVGTAGRLQLYGSWPGTLLWSSDPFGTLFGSQVESLVPDSRMVVSAGTYGLVGFGPP